MLPLLIILGSAVALRLSLVFVFHDGLLGVDAGAYLDSYNHFVLGMEWTGFPRPPLAPGFLLAPFIDNFGVEPGLKLFAATASVLPLIPLYLLTQRVLGRVPAIAATLFGAVDLLWMEMMVEGALPLVGFALIGMVWWSVYSLSQRCDNTAKVVLALSVGLIPWVNQTTAGLALLVLPAFCVGLWWFSDAESRRRLVSPDVAFPVALGICFAIPTLPWYVLVAPGSFTYPKPFIYPDHFAHFVWVQSLVIALPLGIWCAWKAKQPLIRTLGLMLIISGALAPWLANDEAIINLFYRHRYLMALPFYVCASWVVWKVFIPKLQGGLHDKVSRPISAAGIAVFALMFAGAVYIFQVQTVYSDQVTPSALSALEIPKADNPKVGIATNTFSMSVWVGALNHVKSPWVFDYQPPEQYAEDYEHLRCLLYWEPFCDPIQAYHKLGVRYVLVDTKFPDLNGKRPHREHYLAPPDKWQAVDDAPWTELVYDAEGVKLWRLTSPALAR